MSSVEFLAVLACLFVGYWIVSKLIADKPQPKADAQPYEAQESGTSPAWHDVLNVSPHATADEIRAAYKTLMSQYHPDKVASLGEELRTLAERKSKEITSAYRQAMQARGTDA